MDAVYAQEWAKVENFVALDALNNVVNAPSSGVNPRPWFEMVETEHHPVLRWYSLPMVGAWNYQNVETFHYGDDVSYRRGIAFLDGHGTIEDWGCGFAHARTFVTRSPYVGVDGSSKWADKIADLRDYTSDVDCIFMRHILEHNVDWKRILANAIRSFKKRMVLVIFTPLSEMTRAIAASMTVTSFPVPDIAFKREDLTEYFAHLKYSEESLKKRTHSTEPSTCSTSRRKRCNSTSALQRELDEWRAADMTARFWWRDDDAVTDTRQLRRLIEDRS